MFTTKPLLLFQCLVYELEHWSSIIYFLLNTILLPEVAIKQSFELEVHIFEPFVYCDFCELICMLSTLSIFNENFYYFNFFIHISLQPLLYFKSSVEFKLSILNNEIGFSFFWGNLNWDFIWIHVRPMICWSNSYSTYSNWFWERQPDKSRGSLNCGYKLSFVTIKKFFRLSTFPCINWKWICFKFDTKIGIL